MKWAALWYPHANATSKMLNEVLPRRKTAELVSDPPRSMEVTLTLDVPATTYACPNRRTTYRLVEMNTPTPMHGPGHTTSLLAQEIAMDELAAALQMAPFVPSADTVYHATGCVNCRLRWISCSWRRSEARSSAKLKERQDVVGAWEHRAHVLSSSAPGYA